MMYTILGIALCFYTVAYLTVLGKVKILEDKINSLSAEVVFLKSDILNISTEVDNSLEEIKVNLAASIKFNAKKTVKKYKNV